MAYITSMQGLIDASTIRTVRLDASTNSIQSLTYAHHEVHGGSAYRIGLTDADINANPLRVKIVTPNTTKRLHIIFIASSSGESTLTLTEAPTGGATGGSGITPVQRRRDSGNTSDATCTEGVTAPTGGTVLLLEQHGFDKEKQAGENRDTAEWILDQNETYVIELESGTGGTVGNLVCSWYEHTDLD